MALALIVEPDSEAMAEVCLLLSDAGFDIVSASDSKSALAAATQRQPEFFVIRLGPQLPTGAELISSLRSLPGFALTFIVCIATESAAVSGLEAGATAVISSYENLAQMLGFIKSALALRTAANPLSNQVG